MRHSASMTLCVRPGAHKQQTVVCHQIGFEFGFEFIAFFTFQLTVCITQPIEKQDQTVCCVDLERAAHVKQAFTISSVLNFALIFSNITDFRKETKVQYHTILLHWHFLEHWFLCFYNPLCDDVFQIVIPFALLDNEIVHNDGIHWRKEDTTCLKSMALCKRANALELHLFCVKRSVWLILLLLMTWRHKEPRHQQARYWSGLNRILLCSCCSQLSIYRWVHSFTGCLLSDIVLSIILTQGWTQTLSLQNTPSWVSYGVCDVIRSERKLT